MSMTHYMQLLADNQPWNLLIFMAGPVILAETIAICELYLLYTRRLDGAVKALSRIAGIIAGLYFAGIFVYLTINAVIPLTVGGDWRGPADIIAVGSYLAGVVPLGRLGTAEEVARAALFLAGEEAAFINGVDLFVDGGCIELG